MKHLINRYLFFLSLFGLLIFGPMETEAMMGGHGSSGSVKEGTEGYRSDQMGSGSYGDRHHGSGN